MPDILEITAPRTDTYTSVLANILSILAKVPLDYPPITYSLEKRQEPVPLVYVTLEKHQKDG